MPPTVVAEISPVRYFPMSVMPAWFKASFAAIIPSSEVLVRFFSPVWPVIVTAGKGARAASSGLMVPKPLAKVSGIPAITHVLHNVKAAAGSSRTPIVIISPEIEEQMREALSGETVEFILQCEARGTGDAVLCAFERMSGFDGRALVIWSTQPVIRSQTIHHALQLAAMFNDYKMIVPTALSRQPYAPLRRRASPLSPGRRRGTDGASALLPWRSRPAVGRSPRPGPCRSGRR